MHGSSLMSFTCGKLANYPFALGSIKSKLMLSMCLLIALGLHYSLALGSINSFVRALIFIYAWTREETAGRETGQRLNSPARPLGQGRAGSPPTASARPFSKARGKNLADTRSLEQGPGGCRPCSTSVPLGKDAGAWPPCPLATLQQGARGNI